MTLIELLVPLVILALGFAVGFLLTDGQSCFLRATSGFLTAVLTMTLWIRACRWAYPDDEPE